jgi:hypothetical protein
MKKTAFLFVLTASLVMMGFNSIPHHHHGQGVCFERFHDNTEKDTHKENDCNSQDHCILNQVTDTPPEQVNYCIHPIVFKNPGTSPEQDHNHLTALQTLNFNSDTPSPPRLITSISSGENIQFISSLLFTSGLRAPPSV